IGRGRFAGLKLGGFRYRQKRELLNARHMAGPEGFEKTSLLFVVEIAQRLFSGLYSLFVPSSERHGLLGAFENWHSRFLQVLNRRVLFFRERREPLFVCLRQQLPPVFHR